MTVQSVRQSISAWQKDVHELAKEKGWWENWERPFSEIIANLHGEVSEMWEQWRDGHAMTEVYGVVYDIHHRAKHVPIDDALNGAKPEGIPTEAADLAIRLMDFCERYGIDLEAEIARKHEYNKTRPYRHGGKLA